QFMARQLGEDVGQTVGYRIRFESKVSAATRIEVVTEGILTRLIQNDPELTGIGAILFDEFHERHLAGDLGAALALDVQATLRPDLRLVVMSATLDGERIARAQESVEHHLVRVVKQALAENDGDVLAFLPGRREIARAQAVLEEAIARDAVLSLPSPASEAESVGRDSSRPVSRVGLKPDPRRPGGRVGGPRIEIVPLH